MGRDVKQLKVWQKGIDLCLEVYSSTSDFPDAERFGLTAQMRRAAVSVPSDLAEGYSRGTRKDYRQFACIARGSAGELETQAIVASRLGFLKPEDGERLLSQTRQILRMLHSLVNALDE